LPVEQKPIDALDANLIFLFGLLRRALGGDGLPLAGTAAVATKISQRRTFGGGRQLTLELHGRTAESTKV
jgi:hypothetical protein